MSSDNRHLRNIILTILKRRKIITTVDPYLHKSDFNDYVV
jgi:hypothetical protein